MVVFRIVVALILIFLFSNTNSRNNELSASNRITNDSIKKDVRTDTTEVYNNLIIKPSNGNTNEFSTIKKRTSHSTIRQISKKEQTNPFDLNAYLSEFVYLNLSQYKSNNYLYLPLGRDFQIYNQPRSSYTEAGQTNVYKVVLYGNKDFLISIYSKTDYFKKIHFRLIDSETRKILYDNKNYKYIETLTFTVEKSQALDLEVTVLPFEKKYDKSKVCIGIEILCSKPQI
jgi:hypothetical protein